MCVGYDWRLFKIFANPSLQMHTSQQLWKKIMVNSPSEIWWKKAGPQKSASLQCLHEK